MFENVYTVQFLTGCPSSQYRNKIVVFFCCVIFITWNYHLADYGKGALNVIGAVFKRTADVKCDRDVGDFSSFIQVQVR